MFLLPREIFFFLSDRSGEDEQLHGRWFGEEYLMEC